MEIEEMKEDNRINTHEIATRFDSISKNYTMAKADIILCLTDTRANRSFCGIDAALVTTKLEHCIELLKYNQDPSKFFFFSGNLIEIYSMMGRIFDNTIDWIVHENLLIKGMSDGVKSSSNIDNMPVNMYIPLLFCYIKNSKLNFQSINIHSEAKSGRNIIQNILSMTAKQGDTVLDVFPSESYPTVAIADILNCNTISIIDNNQQKAWIDKQLTSIRLR